MAEKPECARVIALLDRFLDQALPRELDAEVKAHAAGCGRCAVRLDSAKAWRGLVDESISVQVPPDLAKRLMDQLGDHEPGS